LKLFAPTGSGQKNQTTLTSAKLDDIRDETNASAIVLRTIKGEVRRSDYWPAHFEMRPRRKFVWIKDGRVLRYKPHWTIFGKGIADFHGSYETNSQAG
jgi:hypothetical protein